ncbi:MAG: AMP-binding protein [Pseudomonadota bacterium]
MSRPEAFDWEAAYPPGVRWDAPIRRSTLPVLLRDAAEAYGARTALECRGVEISYASLAARAERFAKACAARGLGQGDTVAIFLPNTCWHPIAFFGALLAGCRVAHLSPLDPARVLAHKLADSAAKLLVTLNLETMQSMAAALRASGDAPETVVCDETAFALPASACAPLAEGLIGAEAFLAAAAHDAPCPAPATSPDDVALLQYTGGTTGLPKGAMLTHGNLTAAVSIIEAWNDRRETSPPPENPVALCVLPLFHIFALSGLLLRGVSQGAKMLIRLRFDAAEALDDIERHRVTAFPGVPTMWIALVNHPGIESRDLSSLDICLSGGAPLPVEVGRRFTRLTGLELGIGWGMTETSPVGASMPPGGTEAKPGAIGVPIPGLEMKIVDLEDRGRDLPHGEVGEIAIRGPNVFIGYHNRDDATREVFDGDWFRTGDVGHRDEDGFFWLVDRKGDMIISGGFNVYPQMVEQAIYEHPAVAECTVIGVPDAYRGESAKAFVTLRDGAEPFELEDLRGFLDGRLGRHELPRALEFRDELPRTPVGKLSRKALKDEEAARGEAVRNDDTEGAAP